MWKEFLSQTGIRGFHHAKNAKAGEKQMWYCLIVIATGLTCWDVHDTLKYFLSNPRSTKVSIANNDSIIFEKPTFCVPFRNTFENVGEMSDQSISRLMNDTWPSVSSGIHSNEIILDESTKSFLSLSLAVLSSNSRAQYMGALPFKLNYSYSWGFIKSVEADNLLMEGYNQVKSAAKWFERNRIRMNDLIKISGELICIFSKFTLKRLSRIYRCDRKEFNWAGMQPLYSQSDFMCVRVPSEYFTFYTSSELTTFKVDVPPPFHLGPPVSISIDLSGQPLISIRSRNILWLPIGLFMAAQIQISAEYKNLNRDESPCTDKKFSLPLCIIYCMQDLIRDWCKCAPFPNLDNPIDTNLSECNVDSFKLSKTINSSKCHTLQLDFPSALCYSRCNRPCKYYVISFTYVPMASSEATNSTRANFFVDKYDYPVSEEFYLLGFKQFLGSLGGNLSLYLGASFVALFHTVYFWLSRLVNKLTGNIYCQA